MKHPAHLVGLSSYPFVVTFHVYFLATSLLMYFKYSSTYFMVWGFFSMLFVLFLWFKDVCLEGLSGCHTASVQLGLKVSFLFFLFSELMFFFSIFWVYFDVSLSPPVEVGGFWPPFGVQVPSFLGLSLLGTVLLLSSGVTVTWSHSQLLGGVCANYTLGLTLLLSFSFLGLQYWEYASSSFCMSDGIYGSVFFFSTGFHGFHVLMGTLYLVVNFGRLSVFHFSSLHHVGYEASILYWHMVDVVWVFLYLFVYTWGS